MVLPDPFHPVAFCFRTELVARFQGEISFLLVSAPSRSSRRGFGADLPSGGELPLPAVAVTLRGALEPRALGHSQSLRGLVLEVSGMNC